MGGSSLVPGGAGDRRSATPTASPAARPRLHRSRADPRVRAARSISPSTLFIVSSKSGTTLEPNIFEHYFFERGRAGRRRRSEAGQPLHRDHRSRLQAARTWRKPTASATSSSACPSIGGRYSALSDFGMVPAAVMGLDVRAASSSDAEEMVHACAPACPPPENPGRGPRRRSSASAANRAATRSRSSLRPASRDLGAWLEQLIAESTGKHGKGLIPVDREPLGAPELYGARPRCSPTCASTIAPDAGAGRGGRRAGSGGHPVVAHRRRRRRTTLAQELFRWEIATAVAGVDPRHQPLRSAGRRGEQGRHARADRRVTKRPDALPTSRRSSMRATDRALRRRGNIAALTDVQAAERPIDARRLPHGPSRPPRAGDYFALLAYIEMNARSRSALGTSSRIGARPIGAWRPPRLRTPVPALDRSGVQRRAEQRRVPAGHLRRQRGPARPGTHRLRGRQGRAGPRRFRGPRGAQAAAPCASTSAPISMPAWACSRRPSTSCFPARPADVSRQGRLSVPHPADRRDAGAPRARGGAGLSRLWEGGLCGRSAVHETKQLIAVAVAHVTQCPYCIRGHTRAATRQGATPEEIMEAIWVAAEMRAGGPMRTPPLRSTRSVAAR